MAWLLFMDESGQDHRTMPMEVRGGVAIHASKIWNFLQDFHKQEVKCFGVRLAEHGVEIKGSQLLQKVFYKLTLGAYNMDEPTRRKSIRRFLTNKNQKQEPKEQDFYAYGMACISMAKHIFALLEKHDAKLFASAIPRGAKMPEGFEFKNHLRNDLAYLQERFCNFLEDEKENGILVLDQTDKEDDKRFLKDLENYYTKTAEGRKRTKWIVPSALFVDSDMSPLIQAADMCIYCINWGYRVPAWKFKGPQRDEIVRDFGDLCHKLQYSGKVYSKTAKDTFDSYGIFFVEDSYSPYKWARRNT